MPPIDDHDLLLPIQVVPMSDDLITVLVRGEIDLAEAGELRAVLADACADSHQTVVVDLSGVHFIGSSAMGVLARQSHELREAGRSMQVQNCPPRLRRSLEVAGLDQVLDLT